jgi:hypothetical protein
MTPLDAEVTMPQAEPAATPPQAAMEPAAVTIDTVRERVKWRIRSDDAFSDALFSEAIEVLLANDMSTAKTVLFDYIDATIGFDELSAQSGIAEDALREMFGPAGDPRAGDLFRVLNLLQQHQGIHFEVSTAA